MSVFRLPRNRNEFTEVKFKNQADCNNTEQYLSLFIKNLFSHQETIFFYNFSKFKKSNYNEKYETRERKRGRKGGNPDHLGHFSFLHQLICFNEKKRESPSCRVEHDYDFDYYL